MEPSECIVIADTEGNGHDIVVGREYILRECSTQSYIGGPGCKSPIVHCQAIPEAVVTFRYVKVEQLELSPSSGCPKIPPYASGGVSRKSTWEFKWTKRRTVSQERATRE